MERVVITGGSGFIGSHLCEDLLKDYEVLCIDDFSSGRDKNIAHLKNYKNFKIIKHNIIEPLKLDNIAFVFHLASRASPSDYQAFPIHTLRTNSEGTYNMLELARKNNARFLFASTSEVYGDPLEHPQKETYWGNVNPVGIRSCYDEGKRFGEALTMGFVREYNNNVRIVRIFNSILADEIVYFFNDNDLHIEKVEGYWNSIEKSDYQPRRILVPAFDENGKVDLRLANSFIKHPSLEKNAYLIRTRYGREIKVTGDHSVFVKGKDGKPVPKTVRELEVGDYIAIPARLPAVEKDIDYIDIAQYIIKNGNEKELWGFSLKHKQLSEIILKNKEHLTALLAKSGRFTNSKSPRNTAGCSIRKFIKNSYAPLFLISKIYNKISDEIFENGGILNYGSSKKAVKNRIKLTPDVLWFLGLYIAEGTSVWMEKQGTYYISLSSDEENIKKSIEILECFFGCSTGFTPRSKERASQVYSHSKILLYVLAKILKMPEKTREAYIPKPILQLPLSKLKFFLEGYKDGDGTHSGKKLNKELCFDTVSENLAKDLIYLLLRFSIVGCLGKYKTTFKAKYGDQKFDFYRITVCNVDDFNILNWDKGVKQNLNAKRYGDLIWATVTSIEKIGITSFVYDFSVQNYENFVAGTGVFAHNTYGPGMKANDGRVVSNFIFQALKNEPLTVYGDGLQTRSFCYVSDMVDGIKKAMLNEKSRGEVFNLGNPKEFTIIELARIIKKLTNSKSEIVFKPLPEDDPTKRNPDITKAEQILGWEPKVTLEQGLVKMIEHFRKELR